jgi:chromosome segregation ATPase
MISEKIGNDELFTIILELQTDMSDLQKEKKALVLKIDEQTSEISSLKNELQNEREQVIFLKDKIKEIEKIEDIHDDKIEKLCKKIFGILAGLLGKTLGVEQSASIYESFCEDAGKKLKGV